MSDEQVVLDAIDRWGKRYTRQEVEAILKTAYVLDQDGKEGRFRLMSLEVRLPRGPGIAYAIPFLVPPDVRTESVRDYALRIVLDRMERAILDIDA